PVLQLQSLLPDGQPQSAPSPASPPSLQSQLDPGKPVPPPVVAPPGTPDPGDAAPPEAMPTPAVCSDGPSAATRPSSFAGTMLYRILPVRSGRHVSSSAQIQQPARIAVIAPAGQRGGSSSQVSAVSSSQDAADSTGTTGTAGSAIAAGRSG